jgi:hypothetical protein
MVIVFALLADLTVTGTSSTSAPTASSTAIWCRSFPA